MTHQDLLSRLIVEAFQTEESAKEHPRKEADRLGDCPPAARMREIAAHAEVSLVELSGMADELGYKKQGVGAAIGKTFSMVREAVTDRVMSQEKNYRGTLLGLQHGVDLMTLIEAAARRAGEQHATLAQWCGRWIEARRGLVEAARREIPWFAAHLDRAD
jgi:hypothetical protein